jgi:hypothetical protein
MAGAPGEPPGESGPGVVEVRPSGAAEDTATVISVMEQLAAGLPITTVGLEILLPLRR